MRYPRDFRATSRAARWLAGGLCCLALAACSSVNSMMGGNSEKDALKDLKWSYAADGLVLDVQADPALNEYNGQPHMLALVVAQMEDPNAFTTQTANAAKLKDLLLAQSPPQGMLSLEHVFIAPGEKRKITLPRVEKAQYVGLAAGYNHQDPARSARLYRIGVGVESSGIFVKTRTAAPEPLKIDLSLGPDSIQGAPGSKAVPAEPTKPEAGPVKTGPSAVDTGAATPASTSSSSNPSAGKS